MVVVVYKSLKMILFIFLKVYKQCILMQKMETTEMRVKEANKIKITSNASSYY